jgi:hypothetical protein
LGGLGWGPTGVSVDSNQRVWAANYFSDTVMRINPNAGQFGNQNFRIGAVDLTVHLGDGRWHQGDFHNKKACPYNYSDMTGFVLHGSTHPCGSWIFVQDDGSTSREWDKLSWNAATPLGTYIDVHVRTSNSMAGLSSQAFMQVQNNQAFAKITGRFLEVKVNFAKDWGVASSPILHDLTVH